MMRIPWSYFVSKFPFLCFLPQTKKKTCWRWNRSLRKFCWKPTNGSSLTRPGCSWPSFRYTDLHDFSYSGCRRLHLQDALFLVSSNWSASLAYDLRQKFSYEHKWFVIFLNDGMFCLFQSIPRIFSRYTVKEAKQACNSPKNRYVDILPCVC